MKVMWNRQKVTGRVRKTLRWMDTAALKWTLPKIVSIGKGKTRWGKVKISDKITRGY
jgi:hypothetical protein